MNQKIDNKFNEFVDALKEEYALDDFLDQCKEYSKKLFIISSNPNTKQLELLRSQEVATHIYNLCKEFESPEGRVDVYRGGLETDIATKNETLKSIWTGVDLTVVKDYSAKYFDIWHLYLLVENGRILIRKSEDTSPSSAPSYDKKPEIEFEVSNPTVFDDILAWLKETIIETNAYRGKKFFTMGV